MGGSVGRRAPAAVVPRKWVMVGAFGVVAAGIAIIPSAPGVLWLGLSVGVFGVGDALFAAVLESAVVDATTDEYRPGVISTITTLKKLAKSAGPAFFGLVLAFAGYDSRFLLAPAIAVAYVVLLALVLPGRTA